MKILILNWRDIRHPLAGGAEIATHEHAKAWVNAGHTVVQYSSLFHEGKDKEIIDGITIIRKGNHYTVHTHAFLDYIREYKNNFDLIVDEFHFIPFFTPLFTREKKLAYIHEVAEETWFKNTFFPLNLIGYLLEPFFLMLYRNITFMVPSNSTRLDLIKHGIPDKQIHVIANGLNVYISKKRKSINPNVMYLGRLAKDKGIEEALQVFHEVDNKIGNVEFIVVGKEEKKGYLSQLVKKVEELKIKSRVHFLGFVSDRAKGDLLKESWMLVNPSIKEGWGLTVIEAASNGTPTVAYDVAGLRDSIVNQKTGILVKDRDYRELAKEVIDLIEDTSKLKELSKNAQIRSKEFKWAKATSESLTLIKSL